MNHLLKVSVCWMSNFQILQIHPMQKSIIISTKYLINSIMHLSKASNRRVLSSILWQKLQKYQMLNFHNLNSFSWQKTNKRATMFQQKMLQEETTTLSGTPHNWNKVSQLRWWGRQYKHIINFAASTPFSVVLDLYICFRRGWSYFCVFLPVMCQMGSFSNECCFKTQSCLKQHRAPGSSPLWCYIWTQISAASVPVAHFTFNVQFQRRWWSSVQILLQELFTEMTESFPSWGDSPVNSHVTKPLPSHQLKNNMLGFGKNVIPKGLWSLQFWLF